MDDRSPGRAASAVGDPGDHLPPEGSGSKAGEKEAHKAEQVPTPENKNPMLAMFRAESLPTWAEYVRVNRAYDDDEDPNARDVANDLDQLSLTRDGETAVSRVRFDLDLPSAAEDDTPVGPGIALPEWDYRKPLLLPDHCRLQPMIARDAGHAALPDALAATAQKLRGQFAALAPQRRWLKAQADGAELDVDACVRNHADRASGHTPESGAYLAQARCERDLACLLLADLSLSTDAWISDIAPHHRRHPRFAAAVLRSAHRHRRPLRPVRLFLAAPAERPLPPAQGLRRALRRRRARPHPRHQARLLHAHGRRPPPVGAACSTKQPASRRLLLILTDGKPNDLDLYERRYGIEDTRDGRARSARASACPRSASPSTAKPAPTCRTCSAPPASASSASPRNCRAGCRCCMRN